MAQLTVSIGGRAYRLACNEGEEEHLELLAREVDAKFEAMHTAFGEIGDQRLIVMAALAIADECVEAREKIAALEVETARSAERERTTRHEAEIHTVAAAQAFGELSQRIERLTAALSESATD